MADLTLSRLSDAFRVPRASRYSAPENGGDALPLTYGDLPTVQAVDPGVGGAAEMAGVEVETE